MKNYVYKKVITRFCKCNIIIFLLKRRIILHLQEQRVAFPQTQSSSSLLIRDDV